MTSKKVQINITLPVGLHEGMHQEALQRSATEGRIVTISEIYSEAVRVLSDRIDAGEKIIFGAHARGHVKQLAIRLYPDAAALVKRFRGITPLSSVMSTAVRHYLKKD